METAFPHDNMIICIGDKQATSNRYSMPISISFIRKE